MDNFDRSHNRLLHDLHRRITELEASETELKRIEEDLERERDFISAVLDTVDALVLVLDKHGQIISFNRACEQATGYSFDEVRGKYVWDIFLTPDEIVPVKNIFENLRSGLFPSRFENWWVAKNGRRILISWSNTALLDDKGNVEYIVPTGIDITERRVIEEALKDSEERYRRIVNAVTAYTYSVEIENNITVATHHSEGCIALTGYFPADYRQDCYLWYSMIHNDDKKVIEEMLASILAGQDIPPVEHRLIRRDGKVVWVRNTIVPYRDGQGRLFRYDGMIEDITERKLAEQKLLESEKKLRDITSSLAEGLYVINGKGEVIFMNPEAERLLGWSSAELRQKNAHDLFHYRKADGSPLPLEDCPIHDIFRSGASFFSNDEVFIRRDGTCFPISVISSPIRENGEITASVTSFSDITRLKEIEREKEKLIKELHEALAKIKTLHGILPICSSCKKIQDDKGYWKQLESYISENTDAEFSHGLCSECAKKLYPEYYKDEDKG